MRRTTLQLLATGLVLSLALAACSGQDDPVLEQPPIDDLDGDDLDGDEDPAEDPAPDDSADDPTDDSADDGTDPAAGGSDSREITIATADVADRAGVDEQDVTLVSIEMVTWPDGSLGCPEPDRMYTQALVEGYRIVLEAGGERSTYHGALGEDPFHCANPEAPVDAGA